VGQKVHPYGFRLGYNKDWHSHWFAKKQFGEFLLEDLKLKRDLKQRFAGAGVSHVDIEAGRESSEDHYLHLATRHHHRSQGRRDRQAQERSLVEDRARSARVDPGDPQARAQRTAQAEKIAAQLEKRIAFRRAMRKAVEESLRFGAQGIKVKVSGRLNGAEIARSEWHLQGQLPLHTLRADIDYGLAEAQTTFGRSV
jgi:small subunit ribosomal protein S3